MRTRGSARTDGFLRQRCDGNVRCLCGGGLDSGNADVRRACRHIGTVGVGRIVDVDGNDGFRCRMKGLAVLGDKDAASCVDKVAVQVVEAFDVGNAHAGCRRDVGQAGFGGRRIDFP